LGEDAPELTQSAGLVQKGGATMMGRYIRGCIMQFIWNNYRIYILSTNIRILSKFLI